MEKHLEMLLEKGFPQSGKVGEDEARVVLRFLLEWNQNVRPEHRKREFSSLLASNEMPDELAWNELIGLELTEADLDQVVLVLRDILLSQKCGWIHVPYVLRGIRDRRTVKETMQEFLRSFRSLDPRLSKVIEEDYFSN